MIESGAGAGCNDADGGEECGDANGKCSTSALPFATAYRNTATACPTARDSPLDDDQRSRCVDDSCMLTLLLENPSTF